jgi:ATP-dependent Clp protease ATP-binding subunit ClpA
MRSKRRIRGYSTSFCRSDGVLTSGRGDRVYFSEAFIVFTSNLGIYRVGPDGTRVPNVTANDPISEVQARVRSEIDRHFKLVLNRPEILNRIGDNIVVFDFIRPPVAQGIFDGMVRDVIDSVAASQKIAVSLEDEAKRTLATLCLTDLSNGGRGIRNKVETHLVNPLARALFDSSTTAGSAIAVEAIESEEGGVTRLRIGARTGVRERAA